MEHFPFFSLFLEANFPFVFFSKSSTESIAVPSLSIPFCAWLYLDKRKFDGMFWLVFFSSSIVPFYVKQISIKFTFQCHASTQRISERNKEQMSINTECVCVLCVCTVYSAVRPQQIIAFICCFMISIKSKYWRIFKQWCLNHKNVALFAARPVHVCALCACEKEALFFTHHL